MWRRLLPLVLLGAGCAEQVTVTVKGTGTVADDTGAFSCSDSCVLESSADQVVLGAKPAPGQSFISWGGDCAGQKALCTLALDGPKTAEVKFAPQRKLVVKVIGEGRLSSEDRRLSCPETCDLTLNDVEKVALIPTATGTDVFSRFEGDCSGKSCDLVMDKDKTVTAVFEQPPGTVVTGELVGPMDDEPKVSIAIHEDGGFVVANAHDEAVSLRRFDKDGKTLFYEMHKLGKTEAAPGVAFFGDDVVLVVGGKKSSTVARITPDGKTARFKEKLKGCPGLSMARVVDSSVFMAGTFSGQHSCGEASLLAAGKNDVAVVRVSLDDGRLTWAAQTGGKGKVDLRSIVVTKVEDTFVAFNLKKGARVVKFNPAGKAFPVEKIGDQSGMVSIRDLGHRDDRLLVSANIDAPVDFGGGALGATGQDVLRLVHVEYDDEFRHQASKLISRSTCGETAVCTFDNRGGFLRAPKGGDGTFGKKGKDVALSALVSRTGPDGTDVWSVRGKGEGALRLAAAQFHHGRALLAFAARGDIKLESIELSGKTDQVFIVVVRD